MYPIGGGKLNQLKLRNDIGENLIDGYIKIVIITVFHILRWQHAVQVSTQTLQAYPPRGPSLGTPGGGGPTLPGAPPWGRWGPTL